MGHVDMREGSLGQVDMGYREHGTGRYGGGRAWDR